MKSIKDLLRLEEPTAVALKAALAELPIASAAETLKQAQAKRRQQLLEGDSDAALEQTERQIAAAQREHDRLVAYREELAGKVEGAESRERIDALIALKNAAEAESAAVGALVEKRAKKLLDELLALLKRNRDAHAEATRVNGLLAEAGTTDRVRAVSTDGGIPLYTMAMLDLMQIRDPVQAGA